MNVISPIFLHHNLNSQHPNMCQSILFLTLGFSILKETCTSQKKDFGLWCIGQSLKKKPIFQTAVLFGALEVSTPGASYHNKVQSEQGHVSESLRIGNLCYSDKQPLHFSGLKQGLIISHPTCHLTLAGALLNIIPTLVPRLTQLFPLGCCQLLQQREKSSGVLCFGNSMF